MYLCFVVEILDHISGELSDKSVERAGKMAGPMTRELDRVLMENILEKDTPLSGRNLLKTNETVKQFFTEYKDLDLFGCHRGRQHESFPSFKYHGEIRAPGKLKARLQKYAKKLDMSRRILAH